MAGNIIPAIATTNAVVSGLIVLQALQLLRKSYGTMKTVMIQYKQTNPLSSATLPPPNPSCAVCRDTFAEVLCDPSKTTLRDVVQGILGEDEREVSVFEEKRVLADPDWDDNLDRTLESLNVSRGRFLNIVDEDSELETISIGIGILPWVSLLSHTFPRDQTNHEHRMLTVLLIGWTGQITLRMHRHSCFHNRFHNHRRRSR